MHHNFIANTVPRLYRMAYFSASKFSLIISKWIDDLKINKLYSALSVTKIKTILWNLQKDLAPF